MCILPSAPVRARATTACLLLVASPPLSIVNGSAAVASTQISVTLCGPVLACRCLSAVEVTRASHTLKNLPLVPNSQQFLDSSHVIVTCDHTRWKPLVVPVTTHTPGMTSRSHLHLAIASGCLAVNDQPFLPPHTVTPRSASPSGPWRPILQP